MAIDVAQVGQVEVAPVCQQQIAPQALGLRKVVVFGIGVGTQGDEDRGIFKQIHRTVEFDSRWTHRAEATGQLLGEGLVQGKGAAILKDEATKFTEGFTGLKAQDFGAPLTHDIGEGLQEELGCLGFEQLLIECLVIGIEVPQLIELTMQIGDGMDLLSGHGAEH